jgi:predicted ArsR family transcriptional regulator
MAALASALADEAVWHLSRSETAKDVAAALGVSEAAVRKAIQQHNRRQRGLRGRWAKVA